MSDTGLLEEFMGAHPEARSAVKAWVRTMTLRSFRHFADLRAAMPSADYVRPYTVFNIGGNKFRLVASMDYEEGRVAVKEILTHAEYDRRRWRI